MTEAKFLLLEVLAAIPDGEKVAQTEDGSLYRSLESGVANWNLPRRCPSAPGRFRRFGPIVPQACLRAEATFPFRRYQNPWPSHGKVATFMLKILRQIMLKITGGLVFSRAFRGFCLIESPPISPALIEERGLLRSISTAPIMTAASSSTVVRNAEVGIPFHWA
jgi:hypothetical protein